MSEAQFRDVIISTGMTPPDQIIPGKWHKFPGVGKANGNKAGWCRMFEDGTGGVFGCYATGLEEVWQADRGRQWTPAEESAHRERIKAAKLEREAEQAKRREEAREAAQLIWSDSYPCTGHGYLEIKGVQPYGARLIHADNARRDAPCLPDALSGLLLVIPVRDTGGVLNSVQFINEAGEKRFLSGGQKRGCYYDIGQPNGVVCVCEGYATAASIHEATGHAVAVAFDCGNLKPVALSLREKFPDAKIVLCADDDRHTNGNPGLTKAREAASEVGGVVAVPNFGDERLEGGSDFNDLHQAQGLEAVKRCIDSVLSGEAVEPPSNAAEPSPETADEAIERLAGLSAVEYEQSRAKVAKLLGMRATVLDKLVQKERDGQQSTDGIEFDDVTPWPEPVRGDALLSDIANTIQRFIVCKPETAQAAALWVAMTWVIDVVQFAPIAVITAPEMRCGKSLLLKLLGKLSYRSMVASNITPAALFRVIDAWRPTLMIDEADSFMDDPQSDLRGILNSGHDRDTAYVVRVVGDDHTPKQFSTWGAKAVAGIGKRAGTIMDRAITLDLRRRLQHEDVDRLRYAEPGLFDGLASRLCRFADDNREAVRYSRPALPQSLNDRAQDNWEPLLAIADVAGGIWPDTARRAAIAISGGADEVATIGNKLLSDIMEVFEAKHVERITTKELIDALCDDDEKPWATYNRGKRISPRQVSTKLAGYGIRSKDLRLSAYVVNKGYERKQFEDAFTRYLPVPPPASATALQPSNGAGNPVADDPLRSGSENQKATQKPSNGAGCSVVADRKGGAGDDDSETIRVTV
ncbi:MAG: DUF3631 domain-containing protein [Betaproteobacteria bacterium]|nr:DUF3631 domain-containing protein [Betaproteobacteria bacterium]